jgi:hypothetical protein
MSLLNNIPPTLLGLLLVGAGVVLGWLVAVRRAVREDEDRFERKSNPPLHKEYVNREEFGKLDLRLARHERECPKVSNLSGEIARLDRKIEDLNNKVDVSFEAQRAAGSESREKLYGSIRTIEQNVAALQVSDQLQTQQTHEIRQDIKLILGKIGGAS